LDPTEQAGYIVCDCEFNRIRIESPQFRILRTLSIAQAPTALERAMLDIVRTNHQQHTNFLNYFPEFEKLYGNLAERYTRLIDYLQGLLDQVKDLDDREYHQWCVKENARLPSSVLFWLRGLRKDQHKDPNRSVRLELALASLSLFALTVTPRLDILRGFSHLYTFANSLVQSNGIGF
jgi:hypothetical protein